MKDATDVAHPYSMTPRHGAEQSWIFPQKPPAIALSRGDCANLNFACLRQRHNSADGSATGKDCQVLISTFRDALITLREQRGWTQIQLAVRLRQRENTVIRWELGLRHPSKELCEKLALLCDGEPSRFFAKKAGLPEEDIEYLSRSAREDRLELIRKMYIGDRERRNAHDQKAMSTEVASAESVALRAVQILTEQAAAGQQSALKTLKDLPDKLNEATTKPSSLPGAVPGPALEEKQPKIVAPVSEQPWYDLLRKVLRSGEQIAIEAVQKNLELMSRYGMRDSSPDNLIAFPGPGPPGRPDEIYNDAATERLQLLLELAAYYLALSRAAVPK